MNDEPLGPLAKYNHREWRKALRGERDLVEVLVETFGDRHTARVVMSLMATVGEETKLTIKANRWGGFIFGALFTLVIVAIVRLAS